MDAYYTDFSNRLGGGYSLLGDESFFSEARKRVLKEHYVNTAAGFTNFARGCTRTMDGFLKRNGRLVYRIADGVTMFLNEVGLWVGKDNNGNWKDEPVKNNDFSGGFGNE
jgi:hypothetical protein